MVWGRLKMDGAKHRQRLAGAFTLTEMLVVLVIIGLIAAIVGPRLFTRLDDAKRRTAKLQITTLASAVDLFRIDAGRLPSNDEGLDVLLHAPSDTTEWMGPYISKDTLPMDPWGHSYLYQLDKSGRFTVLSYGADGKQGGTGNSADIVSDQSSGGELTPQPAAPSTASATSEAQPAAPAPAN